MRDQEARIEALPRFAFAGNAIEARERTVSGRHAFVDESRRRGYVVCAVVVAPADLAATRRDLKALGLPGQHRLHMTREGANRRRQILSAVSMLGVQALLYEARLGRHSERVARDECLRALVGDLVRLDVGRLVVESCDQDHQDVQTLSDAVAKEQAHARLSYLHSSARIEPLLWLPDILAWAYGKGADWLRRTGDLVTCVTAVDP